MIFLCHSTNEILYNHVVEISSFTNSKIYGEPRVNIFSYFKDIFKIKIFKNKKVFIYNTSPANLVSSFFSKLKGSIILYHIHDPKPHSFLMNPFLYLIQVFQLLLSDHIIVFNKYLISDVLRLYPFISDKIFSVFEHGQPKFDYTKSSLDNNFVNFGFFGRNLPYKNVSEFIKLSNTYNNSKFYIVGNGYKDLSKSINNITILEGFIEDNIYYSIMSDVDYVVMPYKDISFSGIISDAIALGKKMIVSKEIFKLYRSDNMTLIDDFKNPIKDIYGLNQNSKGWLLYHKSLDNLVKQIN
jgi:hypothetical protein